MNALKLFIIGCIVLSAARAYSLDGSPLVSPPQAGRSIVSFGNPKVHELLWRSQWKEAMFRNPEELKRFLLVNSNGAWGERWEKIYQQVGRQYRYFDAARLPIVDSAKGILRELAKDLDERYGLEGQKARLQAASNRCPNCMDELAGLAYGLSIKQAAGEKLSGDEAAVLTVMDNMINKGQLLSVRSNDAQLLTRANDNFATYIGHKDLLHKITELFNVYLSQPDAHLESIEEFLERKLPINDIKKLSVNVEWLMESLKKQNEVSPEADQLRKERAAREQFIVEGDATVSLVSGLIRLRNPAEAERFANVSRTALSVYKDWADLQDPAKNMTKWAFTANALSGALIIAQIMQDQGRSPENEYVMAALDQIREQLKIIEQRLGRIEDSLVNLQLGIEHLKADNAAQFASLKESIVFAQDEITDGSLRDWRRDRAVGLNRIDLLLSTCRDRFGNREWSYAKQTVADAQFYRQSCLIPLLHLATKEAVSPAVMDIPLKKLNSHSDIDRFDKSLAARMPPDLWLPQIASTPPQPSKDKTSGAESSGKPGKDKSSGGESSGKASKGKTSAGESSGKPGKANDICSDFFDVELWNRAVRAYVELRVQAADFAISKENDAELWQLDAQVRAMGKKADSCIKRQLSPERFSSVVNAYRASTKNLLSQITALTIGFLSREYKDHWCNPVHTNSFVGLGTPSDWIIRGCYISGPSYGQYNLFALDPESLWYNGSTNIPRLGRPTILPPDILLFSEDVVGVAEQFSQRNPSALKGKGSSPSESLSISFSRSNQETTKASDLDNLLFGLRSVRALRTVLGQIEAPMSLGPRPQIDIQDVQRKDEVRMCLVNNLYQYNAPNLTPIEALKKCGSEAISKCFAISETTPMSNLRYERPCTGSVFVPLHDVKERVKTQENFLHDDMENFRNQSIATHMSAAMSVRNYGLPRDLKADECGHPQGQCAGQYKYSLTIEGLSPEGIFSGDKTFKQEYPHKSVPANIDETFKLSQLKASIEEVRPRFNRLIADWLRYLNENSFMLEPHYNALNYAYVQLKAHSILHLQLNALVTEGLIQFISAPLSGQEIASAIRSGALPGRFGSRLFLSNDDWRLPFPTLARVQPLLEELEKNAACLKSGTSQKHVMLKPKRKDLPNSVSFDQYCEMWEQIVESEIKRFNGRGPVSIRPDGRKELPFAVGSFYVSEGLELLQYEQDIQEIRAVLSERPVQRLKRAAVSRP